MATVTVSSKGQIVLPKKMRDELQINKGDRLEVRRDGERIVLERRRRRRKADWRDWRGLLAGTNALEEHLAEHREEIEREDLP